MGGMGAGVLVGGILDKVGSALVERKQRQDQLRLTATKGALGAIQDMIHDPSFTGDPKARQDLTQAYFSLLQGLQGGGGKGKGGKGGKEGDPLTQAQQTISKIMDTVYASGQGKPPASVPATPIPGMPANSPSQQPSKVPGISERKGPFYTAQEMQQNKTNAAEEKAGISAQSRIEAVRIQQEERQKEFQAKLESAQAKVAEMAKARAEEKKKEREDLVRSQAYGMAIGNGEHPTDAPDDPVVKKYVDQIMGSQGKTQVNKPIEQAARLEKIKGSIEADKARLKMLELKIKGLTFDAKGNPVINSSDDIPPEKLRALAELNFANHTTTQFGLGANNKQRQQYNKIMADLAYEKGLEMTANRAVTGANTKTIGQLTTIRGKLAGLENTFKSDLNNVRQAESRVPRGSMKTFNSIHQFLEANLKDNPPLAAYQVAVRTAINKYAQIAGGGGSGTASTVDATRKGEEILNAAMPSGSLKSALAQMELEAHNSVDGIDKEIARMKSEIGGKKDTTETTESTQPPAKKNLKQVEDSIVKKYGGK